LLLAPVLVAGALASMAQAQSAAEVAFWNRVRDSTGSDELKAYLEAYPNGAFAETARARLQQLAPISLQPQVPSAPGTVLADPAVIREVQERLYNLNYEIGVLNGQMTEETRNAITEWQKNVKREPTGELNDAELSQLRSARLPTPWGALAWAAQGASAVVWNRPSRQEAVSAALADCHARAGRDSCKVVTAAGSGCGALGSYMGTVRRTTHWGAYASVRAPRSGRPWTLRSASAVGKPRSRRRAASASRSAPTAVTNSEAPSVGFAPWPLPRSSVPRALRGHRSCWRPRLPQQFSSAGSIPCPGLGSGTCPRRS
jgi:Domain of unknown function (DUF4189)/Putative peptidoglycan binding domain